MPFLNAAGVAIAFAFLLPAAPAAPADIDPACNEDVALSTFTSTEDVSGTVFADMPDDAYERLDFLPPGATCYAGDEDLPHFVYLSDPWDTFRSTVAALLERGYTVTFAESNPQELLPDGSEFTPPQPVSAAVYNDLPAEPIDDQVQMLMTEPDSTQDTVELEYAADVDFFGFTDPQPFFSVQLPRPAPAPPAPAPTGLGFDSPSVLSELNTVQESATAPQFAWATGGAVVLGLLMTFPSRLVSSVKDRLLPVVTARVHAWWAARRGTKPRSSATHRSSSGRFPGWAPAVAGLFAAAVISVFIDPRAGFDLGTLRLAISVFLAFLADVAIGWLVLTLVMRRLVPEAVPRFQFRPWTFVLVVAAVIFSRIMHLEPGLTVGLVAGVVFGGALATQQRVRLILGALGYGFVLSILAWVAFSILSGVPGWESDGWSIFLHETLAAITVSGLVALPLALLPVRGLAGYEVFGWSRRVWAVAYGLGLAAFLLVLVPLPSSWTSVPLSFWAWIILFAAYCIVAVGAWLIVFRPWKPETAEQLAERTSSDIDVAHR